MTPSGASCIVDGCTKPLYQSNRYCAPHRARYYRYGDPLGQAAPRRRDLSGQRFGLLTVGAYDQDRRAWVCTCDCGALTFVRAWSLAAGETRSCGQRRRHLTPRTYWQAHEHVTALRGRAADQTCGRCGRNARHWAYRREGALLRFESESGPWSPRPEDYEPLCVRCHKRGDLHAIATERAQAQGLHPLF